MKLSQVLFSVFSLAAIGAKADPSGGSVVTREVSLIGTDALNCNVELAATLEIRDDFYPDSIVDVENAALQSLLGANNFTETTTSVNCSQSESFVYPVEVIHDGGAPGVTIYSNLTLSAPALVNFTLCLLMFANSTLPTLPKALRDAAQDEMTRESNARLLGAFEFGLEMAGGSLFLLMVYMGYNSVKKCQQQRAADAEARQPLQAAAARGAAYGSVSAFEIEEGSAASQPRR